MKEKRVGQYSIGREAVEVFMRDGDGGDFYLISNDGQLPKIRIGVDQTWHDVMSTILHEALEFSFVRSHLRYSPSPELSPDNGAYLFSMNHTQFSVAVGAIAEFIADVVPDIQKAYKKYPKK